MDSFGNEVFPLTFNGIMVKEDQFTSFSFTLAHVVFKFLWVITHIEMGNISFCRDKFKVGTLP